MGICGMSLALGGLSRTKIKMTNLLPLPNQWALSGVSVVTFDGYGETFVFSTGGLAMATCPMPTPTAGHLYYGRCVFLSNSGFSCADGRFEYYYTDAANCLIVFQSAVGNDTGGAAVMQSSIQSISADGSGGAAWTFRNFVVNGTSECYRAQPLVIDLTAAFGAGREPTKEWCDANIPYFNNTHTMEV